MLICHLERGALVRIQYSLQKKINKKTRNCENYFVSLFCRVEEVNPSFEILYGVYGVRVARKFVVLLVWVRIPVNTHFEMLN